LIDELDRELAQDYPPEQQHGLSLEAIFQPGVLFFVARLDGVAVGCGGVALFPTFGEVKRMYVREHVRGRGIAQALLARIESEAQQRGYDVLRLETGELQPAAIRLYERAGYRRCEAFGDYVAMTQAEIELSVFFEKQLAVAARDRSS
jgi:putative acetyltransferase